MREINAPGDHEDSADQQVARPDPLAEDLVVQQSDEADDEGDKHEDHDEDREHAEDGPADEGLHGPDGVVTDELDYLADLLCQLGRPVVTARLLLGHGARLAAWRFGTPEADADGTHARVGSDDRTNVRHEDLVARVDPLEHVEELLEVRCRGVGDCQSA